MHLAETSTDATSIVTIVAAEDVTTTCECVWEWHDATENPNDDQKFGDNPECPRCHPKAAV